MDQLVALWAERDGSAVLEATVVSPYFDKGALAFAALLERLRPGAVSLITEQEAPGLDPGVLRRMMDERGTRLDSKRLELGARRLYDLRHTCATLLLNSNVHPKYVQELLGHASIAQTLDTYSHVLEGMNGGISVAMDAALR